MNALTRQKTFFLILLLFLASACQPDVLPKSPLEYSGGGGGGPVAEGVKDAEVEEFQVRFEGQYGSLIPFDLNGHQGFLSDFPIDLNYLINMTINLELATPTDELFRLEKIPDLDELVHGLDPGARVGEFAPGEGYNAVECRVPGNIQSGEELYCGFQFTRDGELQIVLIFATTQRDLENPAAEPTRIANPPWQ